VVYESWKRTSARIVGPLGLVVKAGIWYLVANLDDRPRTFHVSNLRSAKLLDSRIRRPKTFDLGAYWVNSIERFERGLYTREATLLATQAGRKALASLGSVVARRLARSAPVRRRDGRVKLRIPIGSIEDATGQFLRLSPEVEVLEPAALRQSIIERARNTAKLYGVASSRVER
jgi:predicted DNA-binding transcriptional regulator YafY